MHVQSLVCPLAWLTILLTSNFFRLCEGKKKNLDYIGTLDLNTSLVLYMLAGYENKTSYCSLFLPMMKHIICNAFAKNIHVGQKSDSRQ